MDWHERFIHIAFNVGYGLRISEVINLKLLDLQSNDLHILVKVKNKLIPIANEIITFLKEMTRKCPFILKKMILYS